MEGPEEPERHDPTPAFRREVHKLVEALLGWDEFRQDLDARTEVSEEQEQEIKRSTDAVAREWKTQTRKMEEAVELQSIGGDEQLSRLNLDVERRRTGLQALERELEVLRTKAVTSMLDKMNVERGMKKEKKVEEEEKRQRRLEWMSYQKALLEYQLLSKVKDELCKDIEVTEESISRTSRFSRQLEKTLQCGEKGFHHQNSLLKQLQQEQLELKSHERTMREEFESLVKEEEKEIKLLEMQLKITEDDLQRSRIDEKETERSLSNNRKSNEKLIVILKEIEDLEKIQKSRMKEIGTQIYEDDLRQSVESDAAKVEGDEIIFSEELNIKEEEHEIIEID